MVECLCHQHLNLVSENHLVSTNLSSKLLHYSFLRANLLSRPVCEKLFKVKTRISNELMSFHGGKLVVKLKEESKKQSYTVKPLTLSEE